MANIIKSSDFNVDKHLKKSDYLYLVFNRGFM